MKSIRVIALLFAILAAGPALAQTATLGDSAKALLGPWEFSNAGRDKVCTATFKSDPTPVGFKVEFDSNCGSLFPLVLTVAGWRFPDGDNLFLVDTDGKTLIEFSEVESGIYEAPTPGVGVLFLQQAAANTGPKPPEQVAGTWDVARGGQAVCTLALTNKVLRDGFAVTTQPGCAGDIAGLNFTQWRLDRNELLLTPARGNPWRFEEVEGGNWRRVQESGEEVLLLRQ